MKKLFAFLFCLCMLTCCTVGFAEDGMDAGNTVPEAYYGTAEIDGVKDAAYAENYALHARHVLPANSTIQDGSTAKIWLLWDYEALYVYAEVDEKTPACAGSEEYYCDSVEIFIDENHAASSATDVDDQQFRVASRGTKSVSMNAPQEFEAAAKTNADGTYAVEYKIEWVRMLPQEGMVMGFDVQVNDGDENGSRISCVTWYGDTGSLYKNAVHYGDVVLRKGENYIPWDGIRTLNISVDGEKMVFEDADPVIQSGRTLVPMRKIFESLGAGVAWNDAEQAAYAIGNGKLMIMSIDNKVVKVNGEDVVSDVPVQLINGRTMVPLRFVSEMLGADVQYDEVQGAVFIQSKEKEI